MSDREQSPYFPQIPHLPISPLAPVQEPIEPTEVEVEDLRAEGKVLDGPSILSLLTHSAAAKFVKPEKGKKQKKIEVGDVMGLVALQFNGVHDNFSTGDLEQAGRNLAGMIYNLLIVGAIIEQETGSDSHHGVFVSELHDLLSDE